MESLDERITGTFFSFITLMYLRCSYVFTVIYNQRRTITTSGISAYFAILISPGPIYLFNEIRKSLAAHFKTFSVLLVVFQLVWYIHQNELDRTWIVTRPFGHWINHMKSWLYLKHIPSNSKWQASSCMIGVVCFHHMIWHYTGSYVCINHSISVVRGDMIAAAPVTQCGTNG